MTTSLTSARTRSSLGTGEAEAVADLLAAVTREVGETGVDQSGLDALAGGGRAGLAALLVADGPDLVGYAQLQQGRDGWVVGLAVDPTRPEAGAALADAVREEVTGDVRLWLHRPTVAAERLAGRIGLTPSRALYQVRRPLPVEADLAGGAIATRAFRPGEDEAAWVEVNNRAFAWHPDQSGQTVADVTAEERAAWFDADGFLLHEEDGRLAGFCWTKVHDEVEPAQGEIYVIAVDPDFGGRGLGRSLVLAGLDHLAGRGLTVGMLYVDATNVGAVKLYADLGFVVHHVDVQWTGRL